jgi:hypothetical protein
MMMMMIMMMNVVSTSSSQAFEHENPFVTLKYFADQHILIMEIPGYITWENIS